MTRCEGLYAEPEFITERIVPLVKGINAVREAAPAGRAVDPHQGGYLLVH